MNTQTTIQKKTVINKNLIKEIFPKFIANLPVLSPRLVRWLFSTNAKDIAVLYFIFALFSGIIGTTFSVIIRMELAAPGPQYLNGNNHFFNVLVTGHAFLMIFFMVNKLQMLNSFIIFIKRTSPF
jgi:heme/copper-type cytochrome/quinol oxidase subunit 1